MGTVLIERCPVCQALVVAGTLYEHQQRHCTMRRPSGEDTRELVAELNGLSSYFIVASDTTLQGQPIADDYRLIFSRTYKALREAASRLAAPVGEQDKAMPPIEVGDWINYEPIDCEPEEVTGVHEWRGATYAGINSGGSVLIDSIREVRKADGRIWKLEDTP